MKTRGIFDLRGIIVFSVLLLCSLPSLANLSDLQNLEALDQGTKDFYRSVLLQDSVKVNDLIDDYFPNVAEQSLADKNLFKLELINQLFADDYEYKQLERLNRHVDKVIALALDDSILRLKKKYRTLDRKNKDFDGSLNKEDMQVIEDIMNATTSNLSQEQIASSSLVEQVVEGAVSGMDSVDSELDLSEIISSVISTTVQDLEASETIDDVDLDALIGAVSGGAVEAFDEEEAFDDLKVDNVELSELETVEADETFSDADIGSLDFSDLNDDGEVDGNDIQKLDEIINSMTDVDRDGEVDSRDMERLEEIIDFVGSEEEESETEEQEEITVDPCQQSGSRSRNGIECPEERDYYPYFAPTPYRDIEDI